MAKTEYRLKVLGLGSGMESIPSVKVPGKFLVLNRAYLEGTKKNFGRGFVSFGPNVPMDALKTTQILFHIDTTRQGQKYLNCFRPARDNAECYYLLAVDTFSQVLDTDIFTCRDSVSCVVSYARMDGKHETILLVRNMDTVRIDGTYYEFRNGVFRKSTLQNDHPPADFLKNPV